MSGSLNLLICGRILWCNFPDLIHNISRLYKGKFLVKYKNDNKRFFLLKQNVGVSFYTFTYIFIFAIFSSHDTKTGLFFYSFLFCKKKKKIAFWLFNSGVCNKILGTFQTVKKKTKTIHLLCW